MSVTLRPEVRAFAESMQQLLDQHQDEKGDAWKGDYIGDLIASVARAAKRLEEAIYGSQITALLPKVAEAAASVGLHAMFVADVMGALPQRPTTEEQPAMVNEALHGAATSDAPPNQGTDQMVDRLHKEFGIFKLTHDLPSDWGSKDHTVTAYRSEGDGPGIRTTIHVAPTYAEALAGLFHDFVEEARRDEERRDRSHAQAGRFLERLVTEHGVTKIAFLDEGEMRAVCRAGKGIDSRHYEGRGVTLADALADLLGHLEREKWGGRE